MTQDAAARADELARVAYGRLVAILAAKDGDIESAEDCLADAFAQALRVWPEAGIPSNPEAWLLTVARNRRSDIRRSAAHRLSDPLDEAARSGAGALSMMEELDPDAIPDHRLALLFVCAHPAIDPAVRTPLMLQVVLGFEAEQIARAFAMPTATMAQRLVRAKRRIHEARIPFVVPDRGQMPERLGPVLEAIYGAYAIDFPLVAGAEPRESLAHEAHYLAATLAELLPDEPEALGLAALISLSLARQPARGDGEFVPLDEQDPRLWDAELIQLGEGYLHRARERGRIGRFQIEAAIQSVHAARAVSAATDWRALLTLHLALLEIAPTLGARVAYAAAVGRVKGAQIGLEALDAIDDESVQRFQPAWATRAYLLTEAGRAEDAVRAYDRAIALTTDTGARRYLERRRADAAAKSSLGLSSGTVRVVPYDPDWPRLFTAEARRLETALAPLPIVLEHTGSTSVPGLAAKPVLDILAGIGDDAAIEPYIAALVEAGYVHRGEQDVPGREFFRRGDPRAYHIHLTRIGGRFWHEHLDFRNYLRAHPDVRDEYARLKLALAAQYPTDRARYIEEKAPFIRAVLDLATKPAIASP